MWRKVRETPYQIAYGVLSSVYGVAALIAGREATPNNLDDTMPMWIVYCWCATLVVGGLLMLVGRLRDWGEVEAAGLAVQLGGIACYLAGCGLAIPNGGSALFGIMSYTAIASATYIRLSTVRAAIRAHRLAIDTEGG